MVDIGLLCPIKPYDLDRKTRRSWDDLVQRVAARSVAHGHGNDLLLYIYMAGFYHGIIAQQEKS